MYPQPAFDSSIQGVTTADVITDAGPFAQLLSEWDALLGTSSAPFLKAAWIDCWRRYAMRGSSLHVIAVRDRGRLLGVAPLMRVHSGFSIADRLEFLGTGLAGADYLDVIARDGASGVVSAAVAASVHARNLPLYLDHLPPHSLAEQISTQLQALGWTAMHESPDVCPFINLTGHTWDSLLAELGPAHRANVRRRLRKLDASFDVAFELVDSHSRRRDALERLIQFSEHRWKRRGGTTAFPDSEMIAFHHAITAQAMADNWLRLYTLSLNGDLAAVMYGFALDDRFYFYQHGFDDRYAEYSLGVALMALTIRAAIDGGMREFDFLYGHEPYKSLWARQQRPLSRLELFPPRITGALLRRKAETRRALRDMAHQLGLNVRHGHS